MKRLVWIVVPALGLAMGCRGTPTASRGTSVYRSPSASYQAPPPPQQPYDQPTYPSSGATRPQPPVAVSPGDHLPGTGAPTQTPMPPSRSPYTMPSSGSFEWISSLQQARDAARTQGKLIFLETGRDACGNCQALKNKIIPQASVATELGAIAVGYYDDCDRDPNSQAYRVLKDNLPNAVMLPLVGWVTPDMRWVYGFSGHRDEARFRQDIATARATYLRMAETDRPAGPEREMALTPIRAVVVPTSLPDEELADVSQEIGADAFAAADAPSNAPVPGPVAEVAAAPEIAPVTLFPPTPPVAAPAADESVRAWARDSLRRAADALRTRDVAGARAILAEVRTRAPGAPEEREVDKGDVAIHGLKRLDAASAADAPRIRAEAAAALRGSVWAPLFR